ncbi:unnamed protein product [Periconia digitata]|uniref:TPR-like protein n=1 Tax=Periconia digitata TaxID=1303443 RepID=A0A9W4XPS5_9PLEO|nr:unnamed protein product [Periconia digitata]
MSHISSTTTKAMHAAGAYETTRYSTAVPTLITPNLADPPVILSRIKKASSTMPSATDPDSVDRPGILNWIHYMCAAPARRAALVGPGGVGKSHLALQYYLDVKMAAPQSSIFWVHGGTAARFEEGYREIAATLQIPRYNDPDVDILELVRDWLSDEKIGPWTMVLDNADDIDVFLPQPQYRYMEFGLGRAPVRMVDDKLPLTNFLPRSDNGFVLVTSRSRDVATRVVGSKELTKSVKAMTSAQAVQLLRNKLEEPAPEPDLLDLANTLDCIPLAISQAAANINRSAHTLVSRYLDEFRTSDGKTNNRLSNDAGDLQRDFTAFNTIVSTWEISFEQIYQQRWSAADLMSLMSFFNGQNIPAFALRAWYSPKSAAGGRGSFGSDGEGGETDVDSGHDDFEGKFRYDQDIELLLAYSLVKSNDHRTLFDIHPMVRSCVQNYLSPQKKKFYATQFLKLMEQKFPRDAKAISPRSRALLPHIEPILYDEPTEDPELMNCYADLVMHVSKYALEKWQYRRAEKLSSMTLRVSETLWGNRGKKTLYRMWHHGKVLLWQGKYVEAEEIYRPLLARLKEKLGEGNVRTLSCVERLGECLRIGYKHTEALNLYREALAVSIRTQGEDGNNTLAILKGIGLVYVVQRRHGEAEAIMRRALGGTEGSGSKQGHSWSCLAWVLEAQGKFKEAGEIYRTMWAESQAQRGANHPVTLTHLLCLAKLVYLQNRYQEAELLCRQQLERSKEIEYQNHEVSSLELLAKCLSLQNKHQEAEMTMRRALEEQIIRTGKDQPVTVLLLINISEILRRAAIYAEAEKESRNAFEIGKMLLEDDQLRASSIHNWAITLHSLHRFKEALAMYEQALTSYRRKLDFGHPEIARCLSQFNSLLSEIQLRRELRIIRDPKQLGHNTSSTLEEDKVRELKTIYRNGFPRHWDDSLADVELDLGTDEKAEQEAVEKAYGLLSQLAIQNV